MKAYKFLILFVAICFYSCKNFSQYYIEQEVGTNIFDEYKYSPAYLKTSVSIYGRTVWFKNDIIGESPDSIKTIRYKEAKLFIEKCKNLR
jgi:hypothetical protein